MNKEAMAEEPAERKGNGGDLRGMPADLSKFYPPTPTYEQLMGWNNKKCRAYVLHF
jgi:hypothetical protein